MKRIMKKIKTALTIIPQPPAAHTAVPYNGVLDHNYDLVANSDLAT